MPRNVGSLARVRDLDLNDLRVFVRVVDRGGFAVAARELGVPTSTVSRTIARLEASTGTRLLHRTPRSVHATSEGRAIHASVSEAVAALERAAHALEPATRRPKGVLRVTAPTEIGCAFLADVAVAFADRYPLVQIDLALTNRAVNLVNEEMARSIGENERKEECSPVDFHASVLRHIEHIARMRMKWWARRKGAFAHPTKSSTKKAARTGPPFRNVELKPKSYPPLPPITARTVSSGPKSSAPST